MLRPILTCALFLLTLASSIASPAADSDPRRIVSLDGRWQIAEGTMDQVPSDYPHQVAVPGLADMAVPAFDAVGTKDSAGRRQAFWYRRAFSLDAPPPAAARLKIHKAAFGTRVWLNGKLVGEHLPCFTPIEFDIRGLLKAPGQPNELVIRVGALPDVLPKGMPDGFDFEKIRYIPGIYDSVELILSGLPRIANVQTVPELESKAVRAVISLERAEGKVGKVKTTCRVREVASGKLVASADTVAAFGNDPLDVSIPIPACHLWTPEDPFLYELEVSTGETSDLLRTRFGMRSFHFDRATGKAILNGKPYPMRGTNVCVYRFFEDPTRGDRPWREEWVRRLHRVFKSMHWNSIRYCIGFPPELWYRIADEEGLLIQDEFPIWYGATRRPKYLETDRLVHEYTEWMRERWNHPCVVIWDAQNETVIDETGKAIQKVRGLDLSNRPWDNGWSPPQSPTDVYEAHPYAYINPAFHLSSFARLSGAAGSPGSLSGNVFPNTAKNPVIINEYGWLWLNRDGSPTTLSRKVYERLLGPHSTAAQRRELYARLLAAKTEFWRAKRQVAGVLHFCGLGYSRPDGQTSDHFLDIERLNLDPDFQRYVGDSFAPVGLMVDFWDEDVPAGQARNVPVVVINDLDRAWQGDIRLKLLRDGHKTLGATQHCQVPALGTTTVIFDLALPKATGSYRWIAELDGADRAPIRSLRDFAILTPAERARRKGLAAGMPVTASSTLNQDGATSPAAVVDGDPATRWSSAFSDPQWLAIDLGQPQKVSRVELDWEHAAAKAYTIQVSSDGKTWKDVFKTDAGKGGSETIRFAATEARWIRMLGAKRATQFGYSLWEFRVFP